jgi:ferritin-like metal-binding protein YciE
MPEILDPGLQQLVKYLTDVHAIERQSLRLLGSAARATSDDALRAQIEEHVGQTERHEQLINERLTMLGAEPSRLKDGASGAFGVLKNVVDVARPDDTGKVARDVYLGESLEIVSYELLARTARHLGVDIVVQVAERILEDEHAMRDAVVASFDRLVVLSLRQEGA